MAQNKTQATAASANTFLDSLGEERRADARALVKIMLGILREQPKMWGPSIVGFGSYHYRYESGREGDMPLLCFSPRKSSMVVYNMGSADKALLDKLGKHTISGGCLHIKKLSDIDSGVLTKLLTQSLAKMRKERGD
jgi:hypothetical protein